MEIKKKIGKESRERERERENLGKENAKMDLIAVISVLYLRISTLINYGASCLSISRQCNLSSNAIKKN